MTDTSSRYVRGAYERLDVHELLKAPTSALLGVSGPAAAALTTLGIRTVFDLAASSILGQASDMLRAANGARDGLGRYGSVPGDVVDHPGEGRLRELVSKSIRALRAIPDDQSTALEQALNIASIRELALWPPYLAARKILSQAFGGSASAASDPEMPQDLVPSTG